MSNTVSSVKDWITYLPTWWKPVTFTGGVFCLFYIPYKFLKRRSKTSLVNNDWRRDVVYIYQFPRTRQIPNISPFCLKVETWLRILDVKYEIPLIGWNIRSRNDTLPFIEFNGVLYDDISIMLRGDVLIKNNSSIDEHLTEEQKSISRAFEKLTEKSLFSSFGIYFFRNIKKIGNLIDPKVSHLPFAKYFITQGIADEISRHIDKSANEFQSEDELIRIGLDDLLAISRYLGGKHYFHGFKPTQIDACLFSVLAQILYAPYDSLHRDLMKKQCANLVEYCERIKGRYWADWENVTTKYSRETNWKRSVMKKTENFV